MAVDPNTGQTIIPIQGGANLAGYMDPTAFANVQAGQGQMDQQSALARAMLQQGYIPNSGFGGALAQMVSAMMGMKMLSDSREQAKSLYQQYAQAQADALAKQRAANREDETFKTNEDIRKAGGIKESEVQTNLKYAPQLSKADAEAAAAKAQALLPTEAQKIDLETKGKIQAAMAAAEVANRRGYVVSDAAGQQHIITPQGKEIYQTTSPGGGKLTPTQTELNKVDVEKAQQLQVRNQAAEQLKNNVNNWAATYLGVDPKTLEGKPPQEVAKMIQAVPLSHAARVRLDPSFGGLDAIGNDIGINAAGTKRATPTDAIIAAEQANTMSRGNLPSKNAAIYLNHMKDIETLNKDIERTTAAISGRQAPGTGAVPQAQAGPTNPAPQVHYVYDPQSGKLVPQQ